MSFFRRWFGGAASAHYRDGMRAFDAGEYERALVGFERALAVGAPPGDPLTHLAHFYAAEAAVHLGRIALRRGAPAEALRWFEPALRGPAVSPVLLELAAVAYIESGGDAAGLVCLRSLLAVDPGRCPAHLLAAVACHGSGATAQALEHLRAARSSTASQSLPDVVYRCLEARALLFPDLAAMLRDFVPSPQSSSV